MRTVKKANLVAEYTLTGKAYQDLSDIVEYSRTHWGQSQTNIYITSIETSCQFLADNPGAGKACDDLARGLLSHPVGSHVIFYLHQGDDISVLRVLHKRMLPSKYL
ncbi:MAG: plasmid stabilization protein ParE [Gammaproteobacteria bacterium]|nr:MAG: plasmid stabilization protein ParE [Gammaproteobacteria bacterium]